MDDKKQKTRKDLERALKLVTKAEAVKLGKAGPAAEDNNVLGQIQKIYNSSGPR